MFPETHASPTEFGQTVDDVDHVLLVIADTAARQRVATHLRSLDFRVTTNASFGVIELLLRNPGRFDLLVTAQSAGEMAQFGLPQLTRSLDPELPIVVLDSEAAGGGGMVEAIQEAIRRWPLRERAGRSVH